MSKKTSGLGRGLGDLLDDNAPEVKVSGTVVRNDGEKMTSVSTTAEDRKMAKANDEYLKISVYRTAESGVVAKTKARTEVSDLYAIREDDKKDRSTSESTRKEELETEKTSVNDAVSDDEPIKPEQKADELPKTRSLKAVFRSFK